MDSCLLTERVAAPLRMRGSRLRKRISDASNGMSDLTEVIDRRAKFVRDPMSIANIERESRKESALG